MFIKYLKWKQTFMPKGYISESEISNHLAQNKQFLQGVDKQGRPITVIFGGRHFPKKIPGDGVEELKRRFRITSPPSLYSLRHVNISLINFYKLQVS